MPEFRRTLPPRPSLDQQKKLAKDLIAAFRRGDTEALARVRAELPDKKEIRLADAQYVLAREYGFTSWRDLTEHVESVVAMKLPLIERFKSAVRSGDAKALRAMRPQSAELRAVVNKPLFAFDSSALASVAGSGDVDLVDALLDLGADPNQRSNWWAGGFHPLHSASGAVADRLLAAGAIPDACAAAHLDRADLLSTMIAADQSRAHERGGDGQTPLHFARSRSVVDLLLEAGADPDARDIDHRSTPAQWMLSDADDPQKSRLEVAKYLVERGASMDIFLAAALGATERARAMLEANPKLLALRTGQGEYGEKRPSSYHIYLWSIGSNFTPLQTAARFHQAETLDVMRQFASPEQRLMLACQTGNREEANAIVRDKPGIVAGLARDDKRALTDAAWAANAPAVELMLELGFDPAVPSVSGPTGGTALHCAAWEGSVECVAAILRYPAGRALLEKRDPTYGGTPANWCAHGSRNCGNPRADHAGVARLLLEAGARAADMAEASDQVQDVVDSAAAVT
jgi:ankyrin repeat protein